MNQNIELVFITDEGFALLTGVAIYSLKKNSNKDFNYNINIICSNVTEESVNRFKNLSGKNFHINILDVDGSKYESLKKENLHVSTTALFKFDLPNIFSNLDKILYIDGDVLIQSDLVDLYQTNIDENYAGVVVDYGGLTYPSNFQKRLKIKHKYYFNSGMMLLNLKKLREDNIPHKLVEYRIHGNNFYMDQDALNVCFKENVKYLSLNDNFVITCWRNQDESVLTEFFKLEKQDKMIDYLDRANIVHYASADKPSKYEDVPHSSLWLKYFKESTFKDTSLNRTYLKQIQPDHVYFARAELATEDTIKASAPAISVIIPSYNSINYIQRTLESVLTQSLTNIEVICVDDGSTDGTYEKIVNVAKDDKRVKVFRQKNQFAGVARNNGIKKATGDYLVFLDSDDQLKSGALMKLYKTAIKSNADIVLAKAFSLDDKTKKVSIDGAGFCLNSRLLPEKEVFCGEDIPKYIFNLTGGNPWAKCFKRQLIIDNEIEFLPIRRSEDFYFVCIALAYAKRITAIDDRLLYYRINNANSLESTKDKTPLLFWDATKTLMTYLKEHDLYSKYEQSFLNNALDKIVNNFNHVNSVYSLDAIFEMIKTEASALFDFEHRPDTYWHEKQNYEFVKYLNSIPNLIKYFNDILEENKRLKKAIGEPIYTTQQKRKKRSAGTPLKTKLYLAKKRGITYCFIRIFRGREAGDDYLTKKGLW